MMTTDSLHAGVHSIGPSGVSLRLLLPCCRACRAGAFVLHAALHLGLHPARPSNVQASCLERARPVAVAAFAGALAAGAAAPPGRRCRERMREAKAEGKIKGRGTPAREKSVCTWGWRGTRQGAAACREDVQYRAGIGKAACFARLAATVLDGVAP